ncbi:7667_t:CDS:2 [Diversispora eburnea]|uniref:7667_t:CDS:1 n=1 Tax=Diversispora eburnea TaxID=1213867 RepID=A0A9N9G2L5_9GLOM|nr:7667_t:CDS:2 [Diversispora eburnea]
MSSVFTNSRFMFLVMVIVVLLTFNIDSFNSAPIGVPKNTNIFKRETGQITYYNPGLGACGITSSDHEFVCAIPAVVFDKYTPNGNPNKNSKCGTYATVTRGTRSVTCKIVDRCVGSAAFEQIGSLSEGRVEGSWA